MPAQVMAVSGEPQFTPQHRSTMPASTPSSNRVPGFFKRHLGRRSTTMAGPDSNNAPTSPTLSQPPTSPTSPVKSALRTPSSEALSNVGPPVAEDSVLNLSSNELTKVNSRGSKGGIKWAADSNVDLVAMPRARRASSSGTNARRSSIYSRAAEGHFLDGVNTGVGSKARQLSIHIPDEFEVDECPLKDHFSIFSQIGQKDIGEGGAAVVKLMKSKTAGTNSKDKLFAVKEFRPRDPDEEGEYEYERKIKSEYAIAKCLQHPNIVESFHLCLSDNKRAWYHVMEYCDLGDLNDLIQKGYFSPEDRNCMFKQLIRGIEYLHSRGIAHRDIKSENILVNRSGCLKIADFGTGEVFYGTHPGLRNCRRASLVDPEDDEIRYCTPGMVGSKPYMAPEILARAGEYDPRAVDVWSAGIVYLSLCFGGTPWEAASKDVKNYRIYSDSWEEYIEHFPDAEIRKDRELPWFAMTPKWRTLDDNGTRRFLLGMLHPDPKRRWTAAQVLATKTVHEYPCCQQDGYSDDIKTRQKKALHNHVPPKESKGTKFLKPSFESK